MTPLRILASVLLVAVALLGSAGPATAKILKTRRPGQPGQGVGFTLGSGFEFQADGEQSEYGFPLLLEWALTPVLNMTAEPVYIAITSLDAGTIRGFDDLETTLSLEVISERRYRPGFALEAGVQWPLASREEIGTGVTDVSLGALVTKDLVNSEFGFNAVYSRVGLPDVSRVRDGVQLSLSAEWHLTPTLDLTGELLTSQGLGPLRGGFDTAGAPGVAINVPGAGSGEVELTLGLAQNLGRRLKLEQGLIVQTDGTWQAVLAWEWDFGDGR